MKRERGQPLLAGEKLQVLVCGIEARLACASPPIQLVHDEATSLTLRGELLPARKPKRHIVVTVRCSYPGAAVSGRVLTKGRTLDAWVNLPPVFFTDALSIALSGQLRLLELGTEKLTRGGGAVLTVSFVTRELSAATAQERI
jgi:hypothetical protein